MVDSTETEPLLDPDCRDGKCGSCVGGPCEHDCHRSEAEKADVARWRAELDKALAYAPLICCDERHAAKVRGLGAELTAMQARADHAEKAAVRNRENADRSRATPTRMRHELADLIGIDPCTDWGDVLDQVNEIRRERDEAQRELADMEGTVTELGVVRLKLQATIERVRALRGRSSMGRVNDYVPLADVRAALDGGE